MKMAPATLWGYRGTRLADTEERLLKIIVRIVLDGSGYIYSAYFNVYDEISVIENLYWGVDPRSGEIEDRWITKYYFANESWYAQNDVFANRWLFDPNEIDFEEINRILFVISEAIERTGD